jgi:hypothetical protein
MLIGRSYSEPSGHELEEKSKKSRAPRDAALFRLPYEIAMPGTPAHIERRHSLQPRQLRCIPTTTDSLHQQHAGIHPPPLNIDVIALICQQHRLRSNHL